MVATAVSASETFESRFADWQRARTAGESEADAQGRILAPVRSGQAHVQLRVAREPLTGPAIQGGQVTGLADQLAPHQRAVERDLGVAGECVAGPSSRSPINRSRGPASR